MLLLIAGIFITVFVVILAAAGIAVKLLAARNKRQVAGMLKRISGQEPAAEPVVLRDVEGSQPMDRFVGRFDLSTKLQAEIRHAGLNTSPGRLVLNMGTFAIIGAVLGSLAPLGLGRPLQALAGACLMGALPYLSLRRKRAKRLAECEEQLPEALDFLARSMRAGHAFTISLEMLAEETPAPLGLELHTLFHEQNLGAPLEVALHNLTERVPLVDMRFFASAVLLQRQTGGNLGEILTRLSSVIRERFRLKGQVKAASAHGRLTAMILAAMPVCTAFGLMAVAPGYLQGMIQDADGRMLIAGSVVAQIIGNLLIRKIVDIEV